MGEWRWSGRHVDGSVFAMRGVTVLGIADDHITWGRLYMEVVEEGGASIDEMIETPTVRFPTEVLPALLSPPAGSTSPRLALSGLSAAMRFRRGDFRSLV